jgi:uncharacterized protein YggE
MKNLSYFVITILTVKSHSQNKNFIDQPYVETTSKADTLIIPDRIYLNIVISEKDTRGKISLEELETKMINKLNSIGIDLKKQLSLSDLSSNFKKYFLKQQEVQKAKLFNLLVFDAKTAGLVIQKLEEENISNIYLEKTEYSKIEQLKLELKSLAVKKAIKNAEYLVKPFNQKVGEAMFISDIDVNITNLNYGRNSAIQIRGIASLREYGSEAENKEIEFEKIKVSAEVGVKFKLEK